MTSSLNWYEPDELVPPHAVHRTSQVFDLADEFVKNGWDQSKPTLRGYWNGNEIQLLSGTHRQAAAALAGIRVPVLVWQRDYIERAWGTEEWDRVMGIGKFAIDNHL